MSRLPTKGGSIDSRNTATVKYSRYYRDGKEGKSSFDNQKELSQDGSTERYVQPHEVFLSIGSPAIKDRDGIAEWTAASPGGGQRNQDDLRSSFANGKVNVNQKFMKSNIMEDILVNQ